VLSSIARVGFATLANNATPVTPLVSAIAASQGTLTGVTLPSTVIVT
jgi:hypothetical protein